MKTDDLADQAAVERLLQVQPVWSGIETARSAIALEPFTLLHAGPPILNLQSIAKPIYNSAILAILYEQWASTVEQAEQIIRSGQVRLLPAQDRRVVTPLAAVVSPSMKLQVVSDGVGSQTVAYSPINGGKYPALRFGTLNLKVVDRLCWLNNQFATALAESLPEPIPLLPLADQGLRAGEECHTLTSVGTQALLAILQPRIKHSLFRPEVIAFLQNSPSFFLNLWMAACKCMLRAAEGESWSSLVTAMAGNGQEFGIQLSHLPGQWVTIPAQPPRQEAGVYVSQEHCGAIGDSAVVDALGFGGMSLSYAAGLTTKLQAVMPETAFQLPSQLLIAEHSSFSYPYPRVGLTAQRVIATNTPPLINLAILDREGFKGIIGQGIYRPTMTLFQRAIDLLP